MEGLTIHYRQEYLAANIHEHHPTPFVWVGEVPFFRHRNTLALMPAWIIYIALKKIRYVAMDSAARTAIHCFVCFRRDAIEAWAFAIHQFVDGSVNFVKGDG
jgi:hypothetical protein